jgi:hypothetical protein
LPGELLAPRPRSSLGGLPDAIIYIALHGIRRHLLEVLIGRQNRALSRTCQAGKNNRKTYGKSEKIFIHFLILVSQSCFPIRSLWTDIVMTITLSGSDKF